MKQYGLSLLEALIAIVVLSVGLLGVASLQGMSKAASYQSYQRTLATNLADGIIERIRMNPTAAASYHTGLTSALGGGSISIEPSPDCESAVCSATELAAHDKWEFEQIIDGAHITLAADSSKVGGLLSPKGCIVFAAASGKTNTGKLTLIISWEGMTDSTDAATTAAEACGGTAENTDASRRQVVQNIYLVDTSES
jgi:type IV pilus assembly protein PilV